MLNSHHKYNILTEQTSDGHRGAGFVSNGCDWITKISSTTSSTHDEKLSDLKMFFFSESSFNDLSCLRSSNSVGGMLESVKDAHMKHLAFILQKQKFGICTYQSSKRSAVYQLLQLLRIRFCTVQSLQQ